MSETFGITDKTDYAADIWMDDEIYSNQPISPANDGVANSISAYVDQYGSYTGNMLFALMEATGTPVATLLAQTNEVPITTTEGWYTGTLHHPPNIYAAKSYYICITFAPSYMYVWDKVKVGGMMYHGHTYTGLYPLTISSWDDPSVNYELVLYCTYTPIAPPAVPKPTAAVGNPLIF